MVAGPNGTTLSDLRIFSSDKNATILAMAQPQAFEDACFNIFNRMMNTVPSSVTLSDPVVIRPWFLRESHLDLTPAGVVYYAGTITGHSATTMPPTATYNYGLSTGANQTTKVSATGCMEYPYPREV